MNGSELRLGNWANDSGDGVQIVYITGDNTEWLKPIPLNKEWLLKMGFKDVSPDKNGLALRMPINCQDELIFYFDEGYIRYQTQGSGFTRQTNATSVHQLQNIYFALTGEELTLKE